IWTIGDDICWMRLGDDGRLWAINPEAGYFGVVPGTNRKTNKNAYDMITRNTIFTNVAVTDDNQPWWEGLQDGRPALNWKGETYGTTNGAAAHPNSRFTVSASQNPSYSALSEDPRGVPISAIIFGGRRADVAPLVYEARDWNHGVLVGASVASETTAAATGAVGVIRRDPMAMKPFCGYNFADYWGHWLSFGGKSNKLPRIFHVNWFRQDQDGKFMWPGFGENLRVLRWIVERCEGRATAEETPIGHVPATGAIDTHKLDVTPDAMRALLAIDHEKWRNEMRALGEYFEDYGSRLPAKLREEHLRVVNSLGNNS
ncbi:MAG TPA: phosphoenolpyruvate carboxykinase (GTP), partial [Gammaproteobacteria bacterium]|nr:phosphoenolpyruvate carboxykinase (GTP) [Gammaproteobacteria bacterium]